MASAPGALHPAVVARRRRRIVAFVFAAPACLLVIVSLALLMDRTSCLGTSEARYEAVQLDMHRQQVLKAMKYPPHARYLRSQLKPGGHLPISPVAGTGEPPGWADRPRPEAEEVWRWQHPIDQTIGVVFDAHGRVIFKWVDY
jgi:hypothetical protein